MSNKLAHQIEAYLSGSLSEEALAAFELALQTNEDLRHDVSLSKALNHFLTESNNDEAIPTNEYAEKLRAYLTSDDASLQKAQIQAAHQKYAVNTNRKRPNYFWAAALVGILLLSTVSLFFINNDSPQELYATYYTTDDLPSLIKRDEVNTFLTQGIVAFQNKNYETAAKKFDAYLSNSNTVNPSIYLYIGVVQAELGNQEKAISAFDTLIKSDALDSSKGLWFKALVYLKNGNKDEAKTVLEIIGNNASNFRYAKAKKLLAAL